VAYEGVQTDCCAGADAGDGGGFVAEVLGQSPQVVGVGVEAVFDVLGTVEAAA